MRIFRKEYKIAQPLEAVYSHWISGDTVIPPASRMQIQPRVGGVYKLVMPDGMTMSGKFSRVEPMQALRYSWHWDGDAETTEVEVMFADYPQGTLVSITHSGFHSEASLTIHASGWDSYVDGFSEYLQSIA